MLLILNALLCYFDRKLFRYSQKFKDHSKKMAYFSFPKDAEHIFDKTFDSIKFRKWAFRVKFGRSLSVSTLFKIYLDENQFSVRISWWKFDAIFKFHFKARKNFQPNVERKHLSTFVDENLKIKTTRRCE